jgi:hypothetical protein
VRLQITGPPALTLALVLLGLLAGRAGAGETRSEFWPEVDGWVRLGGRTRLFLLATGSTVRDYSYSEGTLGVHLDVRLKRIGARPKRDVTETVEADRLSRFSMRVGYRYGRSLDDEGQSYEEHRGIAELTGRWKLPWEVLMNDRNRGDFRWLKGVYSFRYRNRVTLEREASIGSYAFTPYGSAEIYFDSRYDYNLTRNRIILGVQTPFSSHLMLDTSFARQNDTRSSVSHVNALGLALNLSY